MVKKFLLLCGFAFFCTLALLLWGYFVEPNRLTVTRLEMPLEKWTGTSNRLRVAVLADLHLAPGPSEEKRLVRIVEKTLEQNPDAVFLLGDYVKGTKKAGMMPAEKIAAGLRPLVAHGVPVFGCFGNHDGFYGNGTLQKAFRDVGIFLERQGTARFRAEHGDTEIQILIALDPDSYGADPSILPEFSPSAGMPTILLAHSPDVFPVLAEKRGVDFTFCGHTHGGQICLLCGIPLTTSSRIVGRDFAYGLKDIPGGGKMFVSRGLGTSILPLRLFCPPEILVVDFFGGVADCYR